MILKRSHCEGKAKHKHQISTCSFPTVMPVGECVLYPPKRKYVVILKRSYLITKLDLCKVVAVLTVSGSQLGHLSIRFQLHNLKSSWPRWGSVYLCFLQSMWVGASNHLVCLLFLNHFYQLPRIHIRLPVLYNPLALQYSDGICIFWASTVIKLFFVAYVSLF